MNWLQVWWQQFRGYRPPDPWEHDRRILQARREQHERLNKAHRLLLADGKAIRQERQFWEQWGGRPPARHPKQTDDG